MTDLTELAKGEPCQMGAIGCSACHDVVDNRAASHAFTYERRRLYLLEGVARTLSLLLDRGVVSIRGERENKPEKLSKIVPRRA